MRSIGASRLVVLHCPRCNSELGERWVAVSGAERDACVHLCESCSGIWLDEEALESVCPTLSDLPARRAEVMLTARRGAGIAACPRCAAPPHEVLVLGVAIDFCTACGGVWLDPGEYDEHGATARQAPRARAPYRETPIDRGDAIACVHCGAEVSRDRALVREHGPTCPPCNYALDQRIAALQAEPDALSGLLERIARALLG